MKKCGLIGFVLLLLVNLDSNAAVVLPKIFSSHMVLQRQKPVPVWGTASPGEKVSVKFSNQQKNTTADAQGNWTVTLDAMQASDKGQSLVVSGSNTIQLEDILVGEVWVCSGQSNMSYEMRKNSKVAKPDTSTANSPVDELDRAHNPQIRIFLVTQKNLRPDPNPDHASWSIAQDSALRNFSAAGYFFAKKINAELQVPVGMVCAAISGSRIEPWMPESAFDNSVWFKSHDLDSAKKGGDHGKFFTRMIEPLAPSAIRGFLWYQGEANMQETITYAHKMELLINSWRTAWHDEKLPFYYVQIVPYYYSRMSPTTVIPVNAEPAFWETQAAVLKIPYTGMIQTSDLNDDVKNLHPPFKWEIGRRLALIALNKTYGETNLVASGPTYKSMKIKGDKIILQFDNVGKGLESHDGKPLTYFTIAGADGKFVDATAIIKGNTVVVSSPEVKNPTAARFGWIESAQPNLFNKDGLPAMPFRTDNPLKFDPSVD